MPNFGFKSLHVFSVYSRTHPTRRELLLAPYYQVEKREGQRDEGR